MGKRSVDKLDVASALFFHPFSCRIFIHFLLKIGWSFDCPIFPYNVRVFPVVHKVVHIFIFLHIVLDNNGCVLMISLSFDSLLMHLSELSEFNFNYFPDSFHLLFKTLLFDRSDPCSPLTNFLPGSELSLFLFCVFWLTHKFIILSLFIIFLLFDGQKFFLDSIMCLLK